MRKDEYEWALSQLNGKARTGLFNPELIEICEKYLRQKGDTNAEETVFYMVMKMMEQSTKGD